MPYVKGKDMKLNSENAFVGAKVTIKNETKYIYKVNGKTFYAGSTPNDSLVQPKGMKFTDFMKKIGGEKYSYGDAEITDVEVSRKDNFIKKEKDQKKYLTVPTERYIKKIYDEKVIGKSTKTYKELVENGKGKEIAIIDADKEGWFLISMRDGVTYFFFNAVNGAYQDYNKSKQERGKINFPQTIEKTA